MEQTWEAGFNYFELFRFFPLLFGIVLAILLITYLLKAIKLVKNWRKNEQSPKLTVPAAVVSKRIEAIPRHDSPRDKETYHVTFEFESRDQYEFRISAREYMSLTENDVGMLHFQGTRYLGFERLRNTDKQ